MFNAYIEAPALIGAFSILFMACTAAMLVRLFVIQTTKGAALTGLILIAFPSSAYTYAYIFTASAYFFGILLSVLSAGCIFRAVFDISKDSSKSNNRILKKRIIAGVLGVLLLACATGIYQAYFSFATTVLFLTMLFRIPDSWGSRQKVRVYLRSFGLLLAGAVAYAVILKIFLMWKQLTLLSYRNMDEVAGSSFLYRIFKMIPSVYKDFFFYYFKTGTEPYIDRWTVVFNLLLLTATIISLYSTRKKFRLARALFVLFILPLCVNCTALLSNNAPIMRYSFVLQYLAVVAVLEYGLSKKTTSEDIKADVVGIEAGTESRKGIFKGVQYIVIIVLVLLNIRFVQTDNFVYMALQTAQRSSESFLTRLVERVESTPGYTKDMEVLLIGIYPQDAYYSGIPEFSRVQHYSSPSNTVLRETKHLYYYLNKWMNVPWKEPTEKELIATSDSEVLKAMPLYPSDGSIIIRDNQVIVRLSESYIPKEDYEIQYEKRR